jgi:hypothetical protein
MDLNVKLQGLKHNFRKDQGCFCKISRCRRVSELNELFSNWKSNGISLWAHGPSPWLSGLPAHRSH